MIQERFDKFATTLVDEFEMQIEAYRSIIEDKPRPKDIIKKTAKDAVMESLNSVGNVVSKCIGGFGDSLSTRRKLDIAGEIINLVHKYQNPEEKKAIREMLVRVSFELFRSYEYQFMKAEKSHGGWFQAMVELARSAIWCFIHYYKFNPQENLDEKYILEGITLKHKPNVTTFKKWWYKEGKNFAKVNNIEDNVKFDGAKMYSKAGIVLDENQGLVYYKNDLVNPEKYGFRRIFSHENKEILKTAFKDKVTLSSAGHKYELDMEPKTKKDMCEEILKRINSMDNSLLEKRLSENMKRITENIVENLMCEMMEQIVATLNGIQTTAGTSTVHNDYRNSHNYNLKADKITTVSHSTFNKDVNFSQ